MTSACPALEVIALGPLAISDTMIATTLTGLAMIAATPMSIALDTDYNALLVVLHFLGDWAGLVFRSSHALEAAVQ